MNQRIDKLRKSILTDSYAFCFEKARLVTESYQTTEGEPETIRTAKAFAHVLENMPIFIEDDELIVGNTASKLMGCEIEVGTRWPKEELEALRNEGYDISEQDEIEINHLTAYWEGKTPQYRAAQLYDEKRLWPFVESGILLPPLKDRKEGRVSKQAAGGMGFGVGPGYSGVNYEMILNKGLSRLIEEADRELAEIQYNQSHSVKKAYYLKGVIIAHRAMIRFAERFAALADKMALTETDAKRKTELEGIARGCRKVPAYPAETFREAIQSFWFIFLIVNPSMTMPMGRFDQYMVPFYQKDADSGKITDEEVLELLQCLRIKDMQLISTAVKAEREKWAGMAKWHNMVIGGVTPQGEDATNSLTYLVLEAARQCPTPHHTVTLRVHDGTPEELMLKALDVVKTGMGMPAFIGDTSYIEYLLSKDVPLEKARDYCLIGCLDANVLQTDITLYGMFVAPLIFEIFMHNGIEPATGRQLGPRTGNPGDFETFKAFMEGFKTQLYHFMKLNTEIYNINPMVSNDIFPGVVASSLTRDGIRAGNVYGRNLPYKLGATTNVIGMINVADSMAAVKKRVFDEKKVSMKDLKAALAANWQGEKNEEMRKLFLAAPKFGNDDDEVDLIAADLYRFFAEKAVTLDTWHGKKYNPAAISISAQWPGGTLTGATPDGRYAGDVLADGSMSPMRGRDACGPTAVIKSASKIDQIPFQGTLLNMKFHPSALKTTEDMKKLSALIKAYFKMGGKHIQFNVVDKETLMDAQEHPENHRDLMVRIAGYSAYFVQLGKPIQDEVIGRIAHQLG